MTLLDLVQRPQPPGGWIEGDNIPWNDEAFSTRMLVEHLSQSHDAASRRTTRIEQQVRWIHQNVLQSEPTRILDLCCGPGLYTMRLAELGHSCVGIDYSPVSIRFAREKATSAGLHCAYVDSDVREADYGTGFGLVMLIFGEFNTLNPRLAEAICTKAHAALTPGGKLVLEPHTYRAVKSIGESPVRWRSAQRGLFSDRPHILMEENHWDQWNGHAITRYYVVDAQTAQVTRYARTMQAYTLDGYKQLLSNAGFEKIELYPSLTGAVDAKDEGLLAIVAERT